MNRSMRLLKFSLCQIMSNGFVLFFGCLFPTILCIFVINGNVDKMPEFAQGAFKIGITMSMLPFVSLSSTFMGYGATALMEQEHNIPVRMELFGISKMSIIWSRIKAYSIFNILAIAIYLGTVHAAVKLEAPEGYGVLWIALAMVVLNIEFFAMAHGISSIFRAFNKGYAVVMLVYFGIMICSGMMGIDPEVLPEAIFTLSKYLPTYYFRSEEFFNLWVDKPLGDVKMIFVSYVVFGIISFGVLALGLKKDREN